MKMQQREMHHKEREAISNETERRILYGLQWEYEQCLNRLGRKIASCLHPVQFCLFDARKRLGRWSLDRKEIGLSHSFVLTHRWGDIREVLLHEIAHQIADEYFHAPFEGETSHGPSFRRACALLGIKPDAYIAHIPMSRMVFDDTQAQEDPLRLKIQKLLALAESANRHEAEAAAAKAREMMARHAISEIRDIPNRDFFSIPVGKPALRHTRDRILMASLLIRHYFVQGIWIPVYMPEREKVGSIFEISGTRTNLQIAAYVHDFIDRYIEAEWQRYTSERRLGKRHRVAFAYGILNGFEEKLMLQNTQWKHSDLPMICPEDPQLETYFRYRHPHIRNISARTIFFDAAVHNDGKRLGKALVIHRGVEETTTGGIRGFLE